MKKMISGSNKLVREQVPPGSGCQDQIVNTLGGFSFYPLTAVGPTLYKTVMESISSDPVPNVSKNDSILKRGCYVKRRVWATRRTATTDVKIGFPWEKTTDIKAFFRPFQVCIYKRCLRPRHKKKVVRDLTLYVKKNEADLFDRFFHGKELRNASTGIIGTIVVKPID